VSRLDRPSTWRTPKKAVKAGGTINAPPTPNSPDTMPPTIPSGTDQPQGSGSRSGWRKNPCRTFKINGRPISVANDKIPATAYCICDITPTLRTILGDLDALMTPDNQSYYGFNKTHGVYFEVIDYNKMLRACLSG
jgi:hypothetical protein